MGLYIQEPDCAMTREQYFRLQEQLQRPVTWSPAHSHSDGLTPAGRDAVSSGLRVRKAGQS